MQQQQAPLLSRVVLLHAAVIGTILAVMQITCNVKTVSAQNIQIPAKYQTQSEQTRSGLPKRIQISSVKIDLPVVAGKYNAANRTWLISDDKAQYITGTTANLTMIYGHNTPAVFELTNSLKPGDILQLTESNGNIQRYRYTSDHLTVASDTSDLTANYSKPTVALLTCNGFWSQDRRFMFFELIEESRS